MPPSLFAVRCLQPFFGDLMGFIGAIACGPTTFWLPPLMWAILHRPRLSSVRSYTLLLCNRSMTPHGHAEGLSSVLPAAQAAVQLSSVHEGRVRMHAEQIQQSPQF
jgi:Transmembrane amino acid transporter protein